MRVLAFGYSPSEMTENAINADTVLIGLVGIRDDVRPEAREAIAEVQKAGIQVVMITGDRLETAVAIARELNIYRPGDLALTGEDLDFLPQELLLRLRAVLRRVYRQEPDTARLGEMEIFWGKGTVRRSGEETALTAKEFALLKKLWEARGNIVTIDALCETLWDGPLVGYENTLMVHIRRLREKIEADPSHPKHLLTVRGLGYRLVREAAP